MNPNSNKRLVISCVVQVSIVGTISIVTVY